MSSTSVCSSSSRWPFVLVTGLGLCVGLLLAGWTTGVAAEANTKTETIELRGGLTDEQWLDADTSPIRAGEIDRMIDSALAANDIEPAPLTSDEEFARRVYLDLTGHLPVPADIRDFRKDRSADKRAKLIDRLLDSDAFAEHWADYWLNVVTIRATDRLGLAQAPSFVQWLQDEFKANTPWDVMVRKMLTANGEMRYDKIGENGQAFFLLSRRGNDAVTERAAEASRIFLGVQIQCAQCHDHPFDDWKQQQFHEFAAYFKRTRERPVRGENRKIMGLRLVSVPFGEHYMPATNDPKKKTKVNPRFLDGKSPGRFLSDQRRRSALAKALTSDESVYFAGSFVNRIWGEMMGQSFFQPVDDLGPQREAYMPAVLARLAGSFRGSDYDIKQLYRSILNTKAYQRKIRTGASPDEHLLFAASYPKRLPAPSIFRSLENTLGSLQPPGRPGRYRNPYARRFGLEGQFLQEFKYDPTAKVEEIEGSISQSLLLMNSPAVNGRIRAYGTNVLGRILRSYPKTDKAVEMVYLKTFARRPTANELRKSLRYIDSVAKNNPRGRAEAFEDLLWVLLNSTEFQTRR